MRAHVTTNVFQYAQLQLLTRCATRIECTAVKPSKNCFVSCMHSSVYVACCVVRKCGSVVFRHADSGCPKRSSTMFSTRGGVLGVTSAGALYSIDASDAWLDCESSIRSRVKNASCILTTCFTPAAAQRTRLGPYCVWRENWTRQRQSASLGLQNSVPVSSDSMACSLL